MPDFIKSTRWMSFYWIGCIVMGFVFLFGIWNWQGSSAFIVGQIVMGVIGLLREVYIKRHCSAI